MTSHLRLIPTIAVVSTLAFAVGCGSGGSNNNGTGIGGSSGAGGGGGASVLVGCTAANTSTAPSNGLIADFSDPAGGPDAGGIEIMGGIVTWGGGTLGGPGSPTYTTSGGALNITESAPATSAAQYVGLEVYFNNCVDASAFAGVQFTISGSFSGCTIQYATDDSAHGDATLPMPNPHATGPAGSYWLQAPLTVAEVTSTPMTVSMPFTGAGAPSGGSPDGLALDPTKLEGVLWQLTIAANAGGAPGCTANLTIDDVKFYR